MRSTKWRLAGLALFVLVSTAVMAGQSRPPAPRRPARGGPETPPPVLDAPRPDGGGPSRFALARLYLSAHQVDRAEDLFARLWRHPAPPDAPREVLAFYLGVCAEMRGDGGASRKWYREAEKCGGRGHIYYRGLLARLPRVERVAMAAGFRPEPEPTPAEVRIGIGEELKKAKAAYKADMTAPNRAMVLAWQMMDAELGVLDDKLYERSADQFLEAFKELRSFEKDLRKDDKMREALEKDEMANARYGAIQVRLTEVLDKFSAARRGENARLVKLRQVVGLYKGTDEVPGCLAEVVEAATALLIGKNAEAVAALEKVTATVREIEGVVREAKDPYLFRNEKETGVPENAGPFGKSFQAHLGILRGYAKYREAENDPAAPSSAGLLAEAAEETEKARKLDPGHPMGAFVLGVIREAQGVANTRAAPASAPAHAAAAAPLLEAKKFLTEAAQKLTERKVPVFQALRKDAETRLARLNEPGKYLDEAEALGRAGKFDEAFSLLREGQLRRRDKGLWYARLEMARRAHALSRNRAVVDAALGDLEQARAADLLDKTDAKALLAEGKLRLAVLQPGVDRIGALEPVEREKLVAGLGVASKALRDAHKKADGAVRAQSAGFLALAIAYQKMLTPPEERPGQTRLEAARRDPDLREALVFTIDAEKELARDAASLESREAMAANHLARGHLAVQQLASYRDEAGAAFGRALTESARLPYPAANLGSLGAPLVAEMKRRPENALTLHVAELTRQRRTMARFVDGAVVLTQGQPVAASEKMAAGLELLKKPVAADDPLEELDLEDRLLGYLSLSQTRAGKPGVGIRTILKASAPDLGEDETVRASASLAGRVPSPTMAYALAFALEQRVESLGLGDDPLRKPAIDGARAAYERTRGLLESAAVRRDNPGFDEDAGLGLARLNSDKGYVAEWQALHRDNRFEAAEKVAKAGLTRNPASSDLWRGYLESRLSRLARLPDGEKAGYAESVLKALEDMTAQAGKLRYERAFYEGVVREQRGEWAEATKGFDRAIGLAPTKDDGVRAESKKAEMRLNRVGPTR